MKTDLEILIAARAVIADPAHWTQGIQAATVDGSPTNPWSPDAAQFCAIGGVSKAIAVQTFDDWHSVCSLPVIRALFDAIPKDSHWRAHAAGPAVALFNNHHKHHDVLALFDRAIENERAKNRQAVIDGMLVMPNSEIDRNALRDCAPVNAREELRL